ncbi:MAG: DUF4469 domain-containing protein [Prevotellaceae bacterium]|jgi:hypothetical protein|nr:DUF4469 domain-containing protein [Prevotellaceae bacterium]
MSKHQLKGLTVSNSVTTDDLTDKRLILDATRSVDQSFVIDHMMKLFPGITHTVAEAVVKQFGEAIIDLVCNGYTVNTDTCRYAPSFKGIIHNNAWDPTRNSIHISITQGKSLREAIKDTTVQILGEKGDAMYIAATNDAATRAEDYTATSGSMLTVIGNELKVVDGSITLTDSKGTVTNIPENLWATNMPKKLTFLIPEGLNDGDYTLTVTTMYSGGGKPATNPHVATQVLTIGKGGDDPLQ